MGIKNYGQLIIKGVSPLQCSLLLKVCQTLKNRSCDVRDAGRNTLVKMAGALGPKYVHYIVKEMKAMLTRGYMV